MFELVPWQYLEYMATTDSLWPEAPAASHRVPPVLMEAQLNLAQGWKSMLVIGSMDQVSCKARYSVKMVQCEG